MNSGPGEDSTDGNFAFENILGVIDFEIDTETIIQDYIASLRHYFW